MTWSISPGVQKKAIHAILDMMKERHFAGGYLRISHCFAPEALEALKQAVLAEFPNAIIETELTTALCSYYAEFGGLILGYEGGFNAENDNSKF